MKVIYYCYGSAHSSVVAASLHVGLIPRDRPPTKQEILSLPYFDKTDSKDIGKCFYVGRDEGGNEVFILGMGSTREVVKRAIVSVLALYGIPRDDLLFVDALPEIGVLAKMGGLLSRRLGLVGLGRPLSVLGVQRHYPNLLRLVCQVRRKLGLPP